MKTLTFNYQCRHCGARFTKLEEVNSEQSRIVDGDGVDRESCWFFAEHMCADGTIGICDLTGYLK